MQRQQGFSLIEIVIVLAIMGTMAALILPSLGLSPGSSFGHALRGLTSALRASYDSAVISGRMHRVLLELHSGEYWTEVAPAGFRGRAPAPLGEDPDSLDRRTKEEERKRLSEDLDKAAAEVRKDAGNGPERTFSVRSILVAQRKALQGVRWQVVDDAVLGRRKLPGKTVFAAFQTATMDSKTEFRGRDQKLPPGEITYYPSGESVQAMIQVAQLTSADGTAVSDRGAKATLILDPLTGQSLILDGFQEPDFAKDTRR